MIQNVLQHIGGVSLYGVISILLFFTFFLGMLGWVWRLKKSHLEAMGELPLNDGNTPTQTLEENHSSQNDYE